MFTMQDLRKTWIINGAGNGGPAPCNFSATIKIEAKGLIKGRSCRLKILDKRVQILEITKGLARIRSTKYADWTLTFTLENGLIFKSKSRQQFVYEKWDAKGKAIGPFTHGTGIFEATGGGLPPAGMLGVWSWQISRPFEK